MNVTDPPISARPPWYVAAGWMCLLGPFFFLVYGGCNWITSQRDAVPSFFWEWERHIPFVPLMILPYMSIDLFFTGSVFMCRDRRELHTLVSRILFTIAASGICFLLFPLRYAFQRPPVEGVLGLVFGPLNANDLPYNLAPSLHISLRAILWATYGRHLQGVLRLSAKTCFILVGYSTLLVWQHHMIDVITGFLMALVTVYLLPSHTGEVSPLWKPSVRRWKIGAGYVAGAVLLAGVAVAFYPASTALFWPALSLALVAAGYLGIGPAVFQKGSGCLSAAAEWTLLPWLLVQSLVRRHWRRGDPWARLPGGVWFGRRPSAREAQQLLQQGVSAVLDLAAESNESRLLIEQTAYRQLSVLDRTAPSPEVLQEATEFIRERSAYGTVYVHCELGFGRSAAVAAAWLVASGAADTVDAAVAAVSAARPGVRLGAEEIAALQLWANAFRMRSGNQFCSSTADEIKVLSEVVR